MARSRNIKPGLFRNEVLGVADPLFTIVFEGLWVLADREGRLEDRPLRIKADLLPYRDGVDIDGILNWLQSNGFILRYSVESQRYISVIEFKKHQNPHKNESESVIPSPDSVGACTENIGSTPADSFNLIPDSLKVSKKPESVEPESFTEFWRLYPNRKAKAAALKAWSKVPESIHDRIFSAVKAQSRSSDWLKDAGQFIPHAATWLNGRRWEDTANVAPKRDVSWFAGTGFDDEYEARNFGCTPSTASQFRNRQRIKDEA